MLRTQLRGELATIGIALRERVVQDEVTKRCRDWHGRFVTELGRSSEEVKMLELFTKLMQEILKDEMFPYFSPLEENSYLGSDGHVYGYKALCVYLHAMPPSGELFFVEDLPHPVVKACVLWLKLRSKHLPPHPHVESYFASLQKIPPLPTKKVATRQAQIRLMLAEEEKKKQRIETAKNERRKAEAQRIRNQVNAAFGSITLTTITEGTQADFFFEQEEKRLVVKMNELDVHIDQLKKDLKTEDVLINQTKRETLQLEVEIRNTERILAERRAQGGGGGWFAAVASVVAAAVLSYILPGSQTSVASVQGGAKLMITAAV